MARVVPNYAAPWVEQGSAVARPREFDEAQVIRRAADVFWEKGYQDASLPDLLSGMGLTRGSLYKAFHDKKSLYLRVLDLYEVSVVEPLVARLTDPYVADGRLRIIGLFKSVVQQVDAGDRRGCMLCTASSGVEMSDPQIAAAVQTGLRRLRDGIDHALAASTLHAGLSAPKRQVLANLLLTQYVGLQVLARSCLPLGIVEQSVQGIDALLRAQDG